MSAGRQQATIFWVVGTATDVGKTTVASALLRCLNARGIPALGFKPIAGTRFRAYVDRAPEFEAMLPGRIINVDCLKLARLSPLTRAEDADLVTPWQLIFHNTSDDTLLIRAGSAALGNVRFFTTQAALKLLERLDLARLVDLLNLREALRNAQVFDPRTQRRAQLASEVQAEAFAALLERRPAAVVVEAAGPFLPTWEGCPAVNHLIAVTGEEILLYPRVDARIPHDGQRDGPAYTKQLMDAFTRRGLVAHRVDQCLAEEAERDRVMDRAIGTLLSQASL